MNHIVRQSLQPIQYKQKNTLTMMDCVEKTEFSSTHAPTKTKPFITLDTSRFGRPASNRTDHPPLPVLPYELHYKAGSEM